VSDNYTYYVFDLPYHNGFNLTTSTLLERKKILAKILKNSESSVRYSDHIAGNGKKVFEKACSLFYEGIISKDANSHYHQKRTKDWLKVKCSNSQEMIVCGYTQPKGNRDYFGALLLGYYDKNKVLQFAGHVGTGFTEATLKKVYTQLQKLKTKKCSFPAVPTEAKKAVWVKPQMVVEVAFTEWTDDGMLRHPSFKGIRKDKAASAVRRESK
jgi:bifunctional non-homologous end joining protein LigD